MKKEHLFFDFDGMMFDTLPSTLRFINNYYGTNIQLPEIVNRGSELELVIQKHTGDLSVTHDQFYRLYDEKYLTSVEWHEDVIPMKNATEVIMALKKQYTLHTVTARQFTGIEVIKHTIDKHLKGSMDYIHCVSKRDPYGKMQKVTKKEYIESIEGYRSGFFDDSLHEVEDVRKMTPKVPSWLYDPKDYHPEILTKNKITDWIQIGEMYL